MSVSSVEQAEGVTDGRFNPARLELARRRRGMTKVELADKVNLTARRIAQFENQGERPPVSTIAAIASALRFPVEFFYRPMPPDPTVDGVSFRSFSRLPAGRRDAALAAASIAVEIAAFIDERFDLPTIDVPDYRDTDPATAALAVRSAWALGGGPAPNVIHLLEAHGVGVYSLTDECAALDGFSLWYDGKPFVFLTHQKSPERGRWDAAHELGHLVLHADGPPQGRNQEKEADAFAASFLLPESGVRASAPPFVSMIDVVDEKLEWQVSAMAYIRRLSQLGLLPERRYKSLVIEASQAGYRRAEGDIERETSQLTPKVLGMLREDGVTVNHIADAIAVTPAEVRGLLFGVLEALDGEGGGSSPLSSRRRTNPRSERHLRAL